MIQPSRYDPTNLRGTDLSKCPRCCGPADNGHDREFPPNPYLCTRCEDIAWRTLETNLIDLS